jgi:hypothetical protein
MQYLERRECEYDEKTLVNFYKVRFDLILLLCLLTRVVIFIFSCFSCLFLILISLMCVVFNPGRGFLAACINRSYSVSCFVMYLLICLLSLPLNYINDMTSYGYGLVRGIFLTKPFIYFCSFTSTPDKESNKYYLGPAPLEEMAR